MKNRHGIYEKLYNVFWQLTLVAFYPVLFHILAFAGRSNQYKPTLFREKVFPASLFIGFILIFVFTLFLGFKAGKGADSKKNSKKDIKSLLPFVLLIVFSIAIRIPMIGTFQRWDAGEYFYTIGTSVQIYKYSLRSFLNNFLIAYHLNYGFSTFVAMPLFISYRSAFAVTIWQIFFSILAIAALDRVFIIKLNFDEKQAALVSLVVGNVPIFLGLSAYCTPDYYMVLFFIYALYFNCRKKYILEAFMLLMMCLSKESAALIIFGYYGMRIAVRFFSIKGRLGDRFKDFFKNTDMWVALSIGSIFVIAMKVLGKNWAEKVGASASTFSDMDFNVIYTKVKIKQYILSNFAWILIIIAAVETIYLVVRFIKNKLANKSEKKSEIKNKEKSDIKTEGSENYMEAVKFETGLIAAMICFMAFGILFHVAPHERYNTIYGVMLATYTFTVLVMVLKNIKLVSVISFATAVLLGIESFVTVDPLTKWKFKQVPISDTNTMNYESEYQEYFGDGLVTNYQYAWLDKSIDKMLQTIDYDTSMGLYFPELECGAEHGVHLEGNGGYSRIGWYPEEKKRDYYDYEMSGWEEFEIHAINGYTTFFPYSKVDGTAINKDFWPYKAYLCFVPYFRELGIKEDEYLCKAERYFYICPRESAESMGGELFYYPMLGKDQCYENVDLGIVRDAVNYYSLNGVVNDSFSFEKEDFQKKIDSLFCNNIQENMVVNEVNEGSVRTNVIPMDSLLLKLELYDSEGTRIPLGREPEKGEKIYNVKVGSGTLIEEIDSALMDMTAGEVRDVSFVVPPDYPELTEYAGQTLTVRIDFLSIVGNMTYEFDEGEEAAKYKNAVQEVYEVSKFQDIRNIIVDNMEGYNSLDKASIDTTYVDNYFNGYFERAGITEKDFLEKYADMTEEEFIEYKRILSYCYDDLLFYNEAYSVALEYSLNESPY